MTLSVSLIVLEKFCCSSQRLSFSSLVHYLFHGICFIVHDGVTQCSQRSPNKIMVHVKNKNGGFVSGLLSGEQLEQQ